MNVAEVLDRAADYIERNGWVSLAIGWRSDCGHVGWQSDCGHDPQCAANAIFKVSGEVCAIYEPAQDALARVLGGRAPTAIHRWNDAPGRTKDEVVAMLRACAMTERASAEMLLPIVREMVNA